MPVLKTPGAWSRWLTDKRNRVYALEASQLSRFSVDGTPDASFSSGADVRLLNGPGSSWNSMQFADTAQSSLYLMGGASCATSCTNVAGSAVIAKAILFTNPTATTTALNASPTTIDSGDTVTFSASVSGAGPTGSVTFKDGSTVLATENLTAASTSYSTSALAVGKHGITAVYSGDDHNTVSSSQVVTETVNALPSGGGGGGSGSGGGGGGGAFAGLELCGMLLLWLCVRRPSPRVPSEGSLRTETRDSVKNEPCRYGSEYPQSGILLFISAVRVP